MARKPTGGRLRVVEPVPPRPDVVSEGVTLEVVWTPHRDAASLLPESVTLEDLSYARPRGTLGPRTPKWSWQG